MTHWTAQQIGVMQFEQKKYWKRIIDLQISGISWTFDKLYKPCQGWIALQLY